MNQSVGESENETIEPAVRPASGILILIDDEAHTQAVLRRPEAPETFYHGCFKWYYQGVSDGIAFYRKTDR